MSEREQQEMIESGARTKLLAISVPIPFYNKFKRSAKRQGLHSGAALLRKLVVEHLDKVEGDD